MADAEQDGLAAVTGEDRPNVPSEAGGELAQPAESRNSQAVAAVEQQAEDTTGQVEEEHARDAVEGEEPSALRSDHGEPEHGDEPGDEGHEALAELRDEAEEEVGRQSIAQTRHEEPSGDEPDLSKMDASSLRELILQMRTDHNQQLQAEERSRAEVEDMCLRIEKHFKAEKARLCTVLW